jgi:hypothetical protein
LPPSEWPTTNLRDAASVDDPRNGADDLVDAARMKQLAVQRERFAMVAEIQPEDVEAGCVQSAAGGQHVTGRGAAFPAM